MADNITEDYVSYETAKLLKEKGFDKETCTYWDLTTMTKTLKIGMSLTPKNWNYKWNVFSLPISAPTLQMATKWLRETFEIHCQIDCPIAAFNWRYGIRDLDKDEWATLRNVGDYDTYEEACEAAIKYCLENLI